MQVQSSVQEWLVRTNPSARFLPRPIKSLARWEVSASGFEVQTYIMSDINAVASGVPYHKRIIFNLWNLIAIIT